MASAWLAFYVSPPSIISYHKFSRSEACGTVAQSGSTTSGSANRALDVVEPSSGNVSRSTSERLNYDAMK